MVDSRLKPKILLFIIGLCCTHTLLAQTIGISEVTSIESKVASYSDYAAKITQAKAELPALKRDWDFKVQKLQDEIASMIRERDNIIADMKVGARCSQCNGWKSEFEKRGENFEKHLGEVKGYAIPATTGEITNKRTEFNEKIAIKRVQLQNLTKGDNPYLRKQKEIAKLEEEQKKICPTITQLSKTYESKVLGNAKGKHKVWAFDLTNSAAKMLIAKDKITLNKARAVRYALEFEQERKKISEEVKLKNDEEQQKKSDKIKENEQRIATFKTEKKEHLDGKQTLLNPLNKELSEIDIELKKNGYKMADSVKVIYESKKEQLQKEILQINTEIKDFEKIRDTEIAKLETENKRLSSDVFQLSADLTKQQMAAIALKKPASDKKIGDAKQAEIQAGLDLTTLKASYTEKVNKYKKEHGQFSVMITSESNRMFAAGQKITCPVWNQTDGQVNANWNRLLACVNHITTMATLDYKTVFSTSCTDDFTPDLSDYKNFIDSLSPEDRKALPI